jgi:hypothetical protein
LALTRTSGAAFLFEVPSDQDDLRATMLRRGRELLETEGLSTLLDRVTFERVVRLADLDRDTAVRAWGASDGDELPQDAFRHGLLASVFTEADSGWTVDASDRATASVLRDAGPFDELDDDARGRLLWRLVRASSNATLDAVTATNRWPLYTAIAAALATQRRPSHDPLMQTIRSDLHDRTRRLTDTLQLTAGVFALELRPPYDWEVVAALIEALGEGAAVLQLRTTLPTMEFDDGDPEPWGLLAVGIRLVMESCLRPAEPTREHDA